MSTLHTGGSQTVLTEAGPRKYGPTFTWYLPVSDICLDGGRRPRLRRRRQEDSVGRPVLRVTHVQPRRGVKRTESEACVSEVFRSKSLWKPSGSLLKRLGDYCGGDLPTGSLICPSTDNFFFFFSGPCCGP